MYKLRNIAMHMKQKHTWSSIITRSPTSKTWVENIKMSCEKGQNEFTIFEVIKMAYRLKQNLSRMTKNE